MIATERNIRHKTLLIAASQELPQRQVAAARKLGWDESDLSNVHFVGRTHSLSAAIDKALKLDLIFAFKLIPEIRKFAPQAVFCNNEALGLALGVLNRYGILGNVELLIYNHNPLSDGILGIKYLLTRISKWDKMVCISPQGAEDFREKFGYYPDVIASSLLPFAVTSYTPQPDAVKQENPYVFTAGVSKRDYPTLVGAMSILGHTVPELVVDASSPTNTLIDKSWVGSLPPRVILSHQLSKAEFKPMVEGALFTVLAISVRTSQRDAGCTLVQAGASSRIPCVAATPGLSDYIVDGITGMIIKPGDTYALASAIKEMSLNHDLRQRMGKNAREHALDNFSPSVHWNRMLKLL